MKRQTVSFALSILLLAACRDSEITGKPAAGVSPAPNASEARATEGTVTADVMKERSSIEFVGAKVTRDHQGKFHDFDGTITYADGRPVGVAFEIDLNSIETDEAKLTQHLKTPDFFDVARYPKATFTSTSLTEAAAGAPAGATHELRGVLDMHGVKKEVTIPVKAEVTPDGVRATSEFTINRHDWGISYRGMADDLIKDDVLLKLNLMFPPPPATA